MTLTRDRAEAALGAKQAAGAPGKLLRAWGGQRWGSARLRDAGARAGKGPPAGPGMLCWCQRGTGAPWWCCQKPRSWFKPSCVPGPVPAPSPLWCNWGGALNNHQLLEQRGWGCFIWDCTCAACCTSFEAGRCWKHTGKLLRGVGWGQPCEAAPGTMSCRCLTASPPGCGCAAGARSSSVEMSLSLYGWCSSCKT